MVYSVSTSENTGILHCVQDDDPTGIRGRKAHPVLVVIPEGNLRLFLLYTVCESALGQGKGKASVRHGRLVGSQHDLGLRAQTEPSVPFGTIQRDPHMRDLQSK